MENTNPSINGGNKGSISTIIGIIIVVVVLIIGAVYILGNKVDVANDTEITPVTQDETAAIDVTDVSGIESDLNGLDVKTLDIDEKNI